MAQHCVLRDILSALVRCTPTTLVQQSSALCRTFYTLRPTACSFWSFLSCISYILCYYYYYDDDDDDDDDDDADDY